MGLIEQFSEHEDGLIRRFHIHPFFQHFKDMSDKALRDYLVQKWFLSRDFVQWYDRAILTMNDPEVKDVLRNIIFDETPLDKPSHREDLLTDLAYIGVPRSRVLTARPSFATRRAKRRLDKLVDYTQNQDRDLAVMAALRVAGEVLVAEEYRHVVPELERRFGLTTEKSVFYAPHFYHDRKDSKCVDASGVGQQAGTHTNSFVAVLDKMMLDEDKLTVAIERADEAYAARMSFFDQFTTGYRAKRASAAAAIAASLGFVAYLGTRESERENYAEFLTSLKPSERAFYLDADRRMLGQFERTGDPRYLEKAGTFEAVHEAWGEGP